MQRYGITLQQIKDAVSNSNANVGGEYVVEGDAAHVVRFLGLIGNGQDPIETAMAVKDPVAARDYLRSEEDRRLRAIREIVLTATNNVPVRVERRRRRRTAARGRRGRPSRRGRRLANPPRSR